MRARTIAILFAASSVVTLGLRAAGAFGTDRNGHQGLRFHVGQQDGENVIADGDLPGNALSLVRSTGEGDEFAWTGLAGAGRTIEIRSIVGDVTATAATGDSVRVIGIRQKTDGSNQVNLRVIDRGDRITVCAAQPQRGSGTVGCGTAVLGLSGRKDMRGDVRVNFNIQLPPGVRLIAHAVDGNVRATGLANRIDATNVNGDILLSTTDAAFAKTVNGNIEATVGRLLEEDGSFKTVNGNVTLHLPASLGARIDAASLTGEVSSSLPLQAREMKRAHLKGILGAGGPEVELKTVSGDVRLLPTP